MAEFVMKKLVCEAGREDEFFIRSSATSTEELGNPVYPPARREMAKHKIDTTGKVAVRLSADDYDKYDLFVGMDSANIRNMTRMLGGDPEGKIRKLMDYTSRGGDVADPWYTGDFGATWRDVLDGCTELLNTL
jgi:protein-tyrosine phosphatase